jgi:hypothetical protein
VHDPLQYSGWITGSCDDLLGNISADLIDLGGKLANALYGRCRAQPSRFGERFPLLPMEIRREKAAANICARC